GNVLPHMLTFLLCCVLSIFSAHSQCQSGWREYENKCYFFSTDTKSWLEANEFYAEAHCTREQGDLLSITEPFEQTFIQALIQQSPTGISMWMGGHDSMTEGGWEWTDGSPFRFIHWNAGNPDDYYGEDCLSMLINSGYWNDDNCEYKRGYICKRRGEK
uniref:C-type lectin domain-containing protein n=1 Tax=Neolamprologus brichardi TaxID=32507 RepID=A0A3Q4HAJ7_NEOBR